MLSLDVPYLRPTKSLAKINPQDGGPVSNTILENCENCNIAMYIIVKNGNSDFVKKGNKTELGLHIETCSICNGASHPKELQVEHIITQKDDTGKDAIIEKLTKEIEHLKEKYEMLRSIKASAARVLFPHQKPKATRDSMLAIKNKHLEELLKKDELEIAHLKDQIKELKK